MTVYHHLNTSIDFRSTYTYFYQKQHIMDYKASEHIQDLQYFGEFGGVNPSISDSSTYTFLSAKTMFDTFEGNTEGCYLYSRHSSPSTYTWARPWRNWRERNLPMYMPVEWAPSLPLFFNYVIPETILFVAEPFTEVHTPS